MNEWKKQEATDAAMIVIRDVHTSERLKRDALDILYERGFYDGIVTFREVHDI